jgi:hypothetical protein
MKAFILSNETDFKIKPLLTNDEITEMFFDMLAEKKGIEEIKEKTGILKVEEDESQTVLTIHYPNGDIISHWV